MVFVIATQAKTGPHHSDIHKLRQSTVEGMGCILCTLGILRRVLASLMIKFRFYIDHFCQQCR